MKEQHPIVEFHITKWNFFATFLLIAICAFQPNADPMGTWSLTTWFWLTLPVFYPWYLIAAFLALKAFVLSVCWAIERWARHG